MNAHSLAQLFSGEDFRWQMRFEKGDMRTFFGSGPEAVRVLRERKQWLSTPDEYAVLRPEAVPLLNETIDLAQRNAALSDVQANELRLISDPLHRCIALGGMWEADFALLGPATSGSLVLQGGVVCFPSSWSLPEKVGKPMQSIHSPVPDLNNAIGRQIDLFLSKLRPDVVWLRSNWGVVRTPELNQHPGRKLPRLNSPVHLDEAFLRIERQSLIALPQNNGVLFGIRVEQIPLAELKQNATATAGLIHGLRTMDQEIASYKGFAAVRFEIIDLLER